MRRDFATYLWDIFDAGDLILTYTGGLNRDIFSSLSEKQDAVERRFEIMGEAIRQCQLHYPAEIAQLGNVQGVVDFRNYLAHRYHAVKSDLVWDIIENDLPSLLARVEPLLTPRNPPVRP
jgi:uncharacterized protein with HEPN domain